MSPTIAAANATFCATLVDQWMIDGLSFAAIAPGSRSTPLALALAERSDLSVEIFHDERSASFAALGHGLATGRAAVVICTSGTAAAHFHAAVIEADLSSVPLLVCTADRPPELWDRGAPQTIDQTRLFGDSVRAFVEPGPPDDGDPSMWRGIARRAFTAAHTGRPGPVHLNLSFREPLTGTACALPEPIDSWQLAAPPPPTADLVARLVASCKGQRGVIIAGRGQTAPADVLALARLLGWPIIADHRSGCRQPGQREVIDRYDSLLRHDAFAATHRPDVVLRLGEIVSSKAVSQWLQVLDCAVFAGRPHGRHIDPENVVREAFDEAGVIAGMVDAIDTTPARETAADSAWLDSWRRADDAAEAAIASLATSRLAPASEIGIARQVIGSLPPGGHLVAASSMPIRDIEWFGGRHREATVISNRGANGIDGTIATAIGVAMSGHPTTVLVGDVAFLHDSTSLIGLADRDIDLTIVVIDNDGGGIFSFLPQRTLLETSRYEQLFGTPHGTDIAALARAHNLVAHPLRPDSNLDPSGVTLFVAKTDRHTNRTEHDAAHQAVAEAFDKLAVDLGADESGL